MPFVLSGAVALATQSLLITRLGMPIHGPLTVSLLSILAGGLGAKAWYLMLHGPEVGIVERLVRGWAVQGFACGAVVAAPSLLFVQGVAFDVFLDATAPGLLFGMAAARMGCFLGGLPRSSDRWPGTRRLLAQLMESALALSAGLGMLWALVAIGPVGGALFIASIALCTLIRQALLSYRAEPHCSRLDGSLVALLTGTALVLDALYIAWTG